MPPVLLIRVFQRSKLGPQQQKPELKNLKHGLLLIPTKGGGTEANYT